MNRFTAIVCACASLCAGGGAEASEQPGMDKVMSAIRANDAATLRQLLEAKPDLVAQRDSTGVSALSLAMYLERPALAEIVLAKRGTPDFFEACLVGDERTVRSHLARGQDVDAYAPDGYTPLGLAVFFRQPAIARLLIDAGANVNARARNLQQVGPVHAAVARADLDTLTLLLERGADPNLPQAKLVRPIHDAAAGGKTSVVALLLMFGADASTRTEEGQSAAELARSKGHTALAARLEVLAK